MILPNLPKQNKNKEANFGLYFRKWWEEHGMNAPYELKDSRGKSNIAFSEVSDEQTTFALRAKSDKGILIRVENGTIGSPDYVGFRNSPSWLVFKYPHSFSLIDIDIFLLEKKRSKRRSLTEARANEISNLTVKL